ncbi:hypothetical protein TBLA_0F00960 [Henningerozyma blattae CBS 6284]|uniref:Small ribosomal subunit protein mS37 n=1 Tax=Henningerozyma blattae (strain ATCC 34711 / CBS 6284 / DSM 70876 / NBRC 10599 / NRRL Y-10934 / UCD 77-7) TaxID=1071380 RepID=I2H5I7_HENB6|nr:hypothetical protein TBLA_0F00960 [Tetrapisispora blattae CBS 6284]CCH61639.1 hypothetical protein TBLA_0F00960 [Tetrapisispora blattae CBS 6284]
MPPPYKLPPLPRLKVKNPVHRVEPNTCIVIMSSLLQCWSSNGQDANQCAELVKQLKLCSATNKSVKPKRSNINYHTARLYPKVNGHPTE